MAQMEEPAPASVAVEWSRRIVAEYRSAALTSQLAHWMLQAVAPVDLIDEALAIVGDEMNHAALGHDVVVAARGTPALPAMNQRELQLPRDLSAPLEHDLLRATLGIFVLGETVAVRLFKRLRQQCSVPIARTALDTILADEVRHRDFGWSTLEWLLSTPRAPEYRSIIHNELPGMLYAIATGYGESVVGDVAVETALFPNAARAWGLMPVAEYRAAVRQCWQDDYTPRFAALGITMPPPRTP